ncbi:MAG: bifunctional phosphopantothenoylcysteine decarboxylase/phosphopantothenate--cysteine ligase CoaBC [Brevinematia bacterium]
MKIAFGITSGIAIYKLPSLIRKLTKDGHKVRVIMTENSTKLMNPLIFKVASGNEVYVKDFSIKHPLAHIEIGDWADVFVIAPLTANTLSKIASGIADNLLTSTFLACDKKKIVFPTMNVKMYESKVIQENIKKLRSYGCIVVEPDSGELACGYSGRGRLPSEEKIIAIITRDINEPLKGKSFIVTAGTTVEKIDPVRFIANFSSGKMGIEIAKFLYKKGANVLLIYGRVSIDIPEYIPSICVFSCVDMLDAIKKNLSEYDGLFMCAAPVDFRIKEAHDKKIKKGGELNLSLVVNPDILKEITSLFKDKFYVGFALETDNSIENALKKQREKNLDFVVLNTIEADFNPMGSDRNKVRLFDKTGNEAGSFEGSKREVAEWIVSKTLGLREV